MAKSASAKRRHAASKRIVQEPNTWAIECLDMIREDLEAFGLSMKGCPPMFYNDAVRAVVSILAREAGLTTGWDVVRVIAEASTFNAHDIAARSAEEPHR